MRRVAVHARRGVDLRGGVGGGEPAGVRRGGGACAVCGGAAAGKRGGEAEFLGLRREALLELVRSDGLAAWSERAVYEAVMGWVRHELGTRKVWLGEMLAAVRMALLPLAYLVDTVGVDPLVRESVEALRILADANRWSRLRGAERAAAESDGRLHKRKHASGGGSGELVVVGGEDDGSSDLKTAEMYDASAGQWQALPDMSVERPTMTGCAAPHAIPTAARGAACAIPRHSGATHRTPRLPRPSRVQAACA